MKTLKDFISSQKVEEPQPIEEKVVVELPLELQSLDEVYNLVEIKESPKDMPAVLIMRRKSVRQMANGQKVALYYVDKLDKYVTIPYGENTWFTTTESVDHVEVNIMEQLNHIVKNRSAKSIYFEDGDFTRVDIKTAKNVLHVFNSLNEENKKKITDMVHKSKEHFGKVVDFARKHTRG